jgi:hypothetical protein
MVDSYPLSNASNPSQFVRRPAGITTGPDGNLWFTEDNNMIGRMSPANPGAFEEFPILTPDSGPFSIAAGSDGGLWFTEWNVPQIGRIDPVTHVVEEFTIPSGGHPFDITAASDGNLWFTETYGEHVGRVFLKPPFEPPWWRRIFFPNNFNALWWLHSNPHMAAMLGDVFYLPAKASFALVGMPVGALTYIGTLGNAAAAGAVWTASTRGDYVITPDMVRRDITPRFVGPGRSAAQPARQPGQSQISPVPPFMPMRVPAEAPSEAARPSHRARHHRATKL